MDRPTLQPGHLRLFGRERPRRVLPAGSSQQLARWIMSGVVLDAASMSGIWLALDASGPHSRIAQGWLNGMVFVVVPSLVHGIILPISFQTVALTRANVDRFLVRTLLFITFGALLIPLGGGVVLGLIMLLLGLVLAANLHSPGWLQSGVTSLVGGLVWPVIAATVAASIGGMAHLMRSGLAEGYRAAGTGKPRLRSDLLGAAFAAAYATVIILVATPMGLFDRPPDSAMLTGEYTAIAPQYLTTVFVAVTSFIPHLAMVGYDMFKGKPRI